LSDRKSDQKLRGPFYSGGGWELGGTGKVAGGDGVDSMLWFRLEMEDDGMKCCWKMKRTQRAHFDSMGMKRDTV
jgi:hypothetical protein